MNYKEIGNTGIFIPPIIFGTSALGNLYAAIPMDVKRQIVEQCFEHIKGPVVFDSAGKYGAGLALENLGKHLEQLEVSTDRVIISNKLGWKRVPLTTPEPSFEKGVWMELENDAVQDISYEGILHCYEQGNELLGGRYLPQLLSVHDPDEYINAAYGDEDRAKRFSDIIDAYRALADLKADGKVAAIGVGAKDWKVIKSIAEIVELDWVMFANSMTIMQHPTDLLNFMRELDRKNISIINSAVFHAGFLIGGRFFDYQEIRPDTPKNRQLFHWREEFFAICHAHNIKPANACVQFAISAPGVKSIALNTSDPKRIQNNVELVTQKIPKEFWEEMKKKKLINEEYPYL